MSPSAVVLSRRLLARPLRRRNSPDVANAKLRRGNRFGTATFRGKDRYQPADSLRLTQERHRRSFDATDPSAACRRQAKSGPLSPSHRIETGFVVTKRATVSFNTSVIAVRAEDPASDNLAGRFVRENLCCSGKDTRSRLRSLTRLEKAHLYSTREDLKPAGFRCALPVPCPTTSEPSDTMLGNLRDSLDQQQWTSVNFDDSSSDDSDSENDLEGFAAIKTTGLRDSMDMRRLRLSSADLSDLEKDLEGLAEEFPGGVPAEEMVAVERV